MSYSSSRYILGGYDPAKFWVGGNDLVTEGQWMWAKTHTRIIDTGYQNWDSGQPDNSDGSGENCMELSKSSHWRWNDETCEHEKYFICEKE